MTTLEITLLSILIPIFFIILCVLLYSTFKIIYFKKYTNYLIEFETFLDNSPYIETLTALNTVDIKLKLQEEELEKTMLTLTNNLINDWMEVNGIALKEIESKKENYAIQKIEVEDAIVKLKKLKEDLIKCLDESQIFRCRPIIKSINKIRNNMNSKKNIVASITKEFIVPTIEYESKKQLYEKILNDLENITEEWKNKVDSDLFYSNVNDRIRKINDHMDKATKFININKEFETYENFTLSKKAMYDLLNFANYFDNFYKSIFSKAEEDLKNVLTYLSNVRANLENDLKYLNIDILEEQAQKELIDIKQSFYDLKIEETKDNLSKFYKTLLSLTFNLSTELKAFNFLNIYKISYLESLFENAYKKLNELNENIVNLLHIDKMFYLNLENEKEEIIELINEIDKKLNGDLKETLVNQNISYKDKQSKFKNLLFDFQALFLSIERSEKMISIFYNEGVSQSLKYHQMKRLYLKGLSEAKKMNIILSIEDKEIIQKLEEIKNDIETKVFDNELFNEKDLQLFIEKFKQLLMDFIFSIMKKTIIVKLFYIINIKYSYARINNKSLDKKIDDIENELSEGKYEIAFSNLINCINKEIN